MGGYPGHSRPTRERSHGVARPESVAIGRISLRRKPRVEARFRCALKVRLLDRRARVNADNAQLLIIGVLEAVRGLLRHDDHVAGAHYDVLPVDRESGGSGLYNERLGVRMQVLIRPSPRSYWVMNIETGISSRPWNSAARLLRRSSSIGVTVVTCARLTLLISGPARVSGTLGVSGPASATGTRR